MKERGLYYPDGSFRTDKDIKRKLALNGEVPVFETPLTTRQSFTDYWSPRFVRRQKEFQETQEIKDHVEISFNGDILLSLIGDTHVGGDCDYERLAQEVEAIVNTPASYVMLVGDLVDGFFFNPAQFEQIEQAPEQFKYMRSLIHYLGENKKLLVAWSGDHDSWVEKMGLSAYSEFSDYSGAYLMRGVGYVTLNVGDQVYKLTGAHRLPGNSIYNSTHPQKRALAFGGAHGSDIIVSAHTHKKGHSDEPVTDYGGETRLVHQISLGPYKTSDDYAKKLGLKPLDGHLNQDRSAALFGSSIYLSSDRHEITYFPDIIRAHQEVSHV